MDCTEVPRSFYWSGYKESVTSMYFKVYPQGQFPYLKEGDVHETDGVDTIYKFSNT